jgi:hypothetical protein
VTRPPAPDSGRGRAPEQPARRAEGRGPLGRPAGMGRVRDRRDTDVRLEPEPWPIREDRGRPSPQPGGAASESATTLHACARGLERPRIGVLVRIAPGPPNCRLRTRSRLPWKAGWAEGGPIFAAREATCARSPRHGRRAPRPRAGDGRRQSRRTASAQDASAEGAPDAASPRNAAALPEALFARAPAG